MGIMADIEKNRKYGKRSISGFGVDEFAKPDVRGETGPYRQVDRSPQVGDTRAPTPTPGSLSEEGDRATGPRGEIGIRADLNRIPVIPDRSNGIQKDHSRQGRLRPRSQRLRRASSPDAP